jgi:hypothetical protein
MRGYSESDRERERERVEPHLGIYVCWVQVGVFSLSKNVWVCFKSG